MIAPENWETSEQISSRFLNVSKEYVEKIISLLGIQDSEFHCVTTPLGYSYSPKAVKLILRELKSRGKT